MKNIKLLVLTAMASLTLVGCGSKTGTLPSGGKKVDLSTEAGQATLREKINAAQKAYQELSFDSASVTGTLSGVSLNGKANAEIEEVGKINLEAGLKDFGGKVEFKAAKHAKGEGEEYDSVDASLVAKTTSGSLSVKGSIPGKEEGKTAKIDSSLSLKGAEADAYVSGNRIYLNANTDGNAKLAGNIDEFANKLLGQLQESFFEPMLSFIIPSDIPEEVFNRKDLKFTLADYWKEASKEAQIYLQMDKPIEWPTFEAEEAKEGEKSNIDEFIEGATELAKQNVGFEFVTYSNNAFGFAFAMNKESLINLVKATSESEEEGKENAENVEKYINKFSLNADVYFNKNCLLESAGATVSLDAKLNKDTLGEAGASFKSFDASVSAKATAKVEVKYGGVKVEFPSFDGYKEFKLFGN